MGFSQRNGIDWLILSIADNVRINLVQFDVSTVFLYGKFEATIYMNWPSGYTDGTDRVRTVKRSL